MTIWGYYRVSTEQQTIQSQRMDVLEYCKRNNLVLDQEIMDNGISGTVKAQERNFNIILKRCKQGDKIIVSELSRIGRSTINVLNVCNELIKKKVNVYFVKQGMSLDNTPMGKLMISIFAAFAEMERDLISQRTLDGLKRVKENGQKLGRPKGSLNKVKGKKFSKIHEKISLIKDFRKYLIKLKQKTLEKRKIRTIYDPNNKIGIITIAKDLKINRHSLSDYFKTRPDLMKIISEVCYGEN